jgi:glycogen debranching enzyme
VNEVIEVNNQFYILAGSSLADDRAFVLKSGDTFALFDHYGDIRAYGLGEQGIFHEGTRFLSSSELRIENKRPFFLSSDADGGSFILGIDLSNPDLIGPNEVLVPRGTIHIARRKFLCNGMCHEELEIGNFAMEDIDLRLILRFDADFADIFEVRGTRRALRGERFEPQAIDGGILFRYRGLDDVTRATRISFKPAPETVSRGSAQFALRLSGRVSEKIYVSIACETGPPAISPPRYEVARTAVSHELAQLRAEMAEIKTFTGSFNHSLDRSRADIFLMLTRTPHGLYPYAGVPWFSTPFGRDGIITALEMLWVCPSIARGVLAFLAATQARVVDDAADCTPGKILHEMRGGEMAALGEIPFGRYYGSVDATPLFVMLAGAYYDHTGDREFIETIWPNIEAAMNWNLSNTRNVRRKACRIRAGRIRWMTSLTRMDSWQKPPSLSARCRATCTRPRAPLQNCAGFWATSGRRKRGRLQLNP